MWYGELMAETGRLERKLEHMALAVELDPLAPAQRSNYGWAHIVNGDHAGGERECRTAWDMGLKAMSVWQCVYGLLLFRERFGEVEAGWSIVDESVDGGEYDLVRSLFGPPMELLHDDPRFVEIVHRLGLVDYWRATDWGPICRPVGGVECGSI